MTEKDPNMRECVAMVIGIVIASVGFVFQLASKACEYIAGGFLKTADWAYEKISGIK